MSALPPTGENEAGRPGRIAVMLPRYSLYGGVEQFGYRLAEALAGRGHAVDFICARQEAPAPRGVRVIRVGRPPGFRCLKMLWFLIGAEVQRRRGGYDLSISLGKTWNQDLCRMGGGPLSIFWKKSELAIPAGAPRLLRRLRRRLQPSNWLACLVEKHQFGPKSEVIAVSHLVRDWLLEAHPGLSPERVGVIYNRPDIRRFFPPSPEERATARQLLRAQSESPLEPGGVWIGTASTNFELKGVSPLIRALALLPEHTALFVAGGRAPESYQRLADSLGLSDRVVFCGKVDDMPSFYKALDIFILPTFYDACSNAVLEALACGCKTLTSSSNGAAFFLGPEAVFSDPGDAKELARRLRAAMEQPASPPFVWPENVPSGLEDFLRRVEAMLVRQQGAS